MTGMWIAIGVLLFAAVLVLLGVYAKTRRRGMAAAGKAKVEKALAQALSQQDAVRRVLAADAVLDLALTELGFAGSLEESGPAHPEHPGGVGGAQAPQPTRARARRVGERRAG